ncbi:SprT family zinc-dependent metalloprotease [uncultured Ferrimonas sp.]|uniref:M48 family metallopeptidase n=1 Tax=uncultured Ferrimonas sp. TaxID=432640 RepID=UPI00262DE366|nr:SprT family zinc-dependent metalloprotease [uncultured Ferrimonas sp.]
MAAEKGRSTEYLQGDGYVVEVRRTTRRKTASIQVEDGQVMVIVPHQLEVERISKLIAAKHRWIIEKIALHDAVLPPSSKSYVSGEAFPYLGRNYRLKVLTGAYMPAKLVQGRLQVTVPAYGDPANAVRNSLIRWYRSHAHNKLREKCARYAEVVGVRPTSVSVKQFKSRWGSCTTKGELEFNWVIVMAPNRIVDYVVVHELGHLKHHDHSPQFWREVERVIPDYAECREWLRENSGRLVL